MKTTIAILLALTSTLSAYAQASSEASTPPFSYGVDRYLGDWTAVDSDGGCIRLVISKENDKLMLHGWGDCQPKPCDWGSVEVKTVAASVNQKLNALPFDFLFAEWKTSFNTTYMKLYLSNSPKPQLIVESISTFVDDRQPYHSTDIFREKQ